MTRKIIWIGLFPPHNLSVGDHAQVVAIQKWFRDYFPNLEVVRSYRQLPDGIENWDRFLTTTKRDDLIFIHSSGDFGSLFCWTGVPPPDRWHGMRKKFISTFPGNKIIQLPVTAYYHDNEVGRKTLEEDRQFYKDKNNVILMAREQVSYEILANSLDCKSLFVPDFVFYLKPILVNRERNGALLALRSDHEARFNQNEKLKVKDIIAEFIPNIVVKDVQISSCPLTDKNRENYINEILDYYQNFEVMITDRMHGMIFSVITKTPCIALDDRIPHKLSGYKSLLSRSVKFVKNIEGIHYAITEILSEPYQETDLTSHFTNLNEEILKNA